MNKQPILFRTIFALIVVIVFAWSMYPLQQQDLYKVFQKKLVKKDKEIEKVFELAKEKQKTQKDLYAAVAIDNAAVDLGVDLTKYVEVKGATCNRDVITYIREQASSSIRLGLDLNGGAEFLLELKPKKDAEGNIEDAAKNFNKYRDAAIEILRNRLDSQKIYETEISPAGSKYISLKAPVVSKEEKLKLLNLIRMSAKLQFALVHKDSEALVAQYNALSDDEKLRFSPPSGYRRMDMIEKDSGKAPVKRMYFIKNRPEMEGADIAKAGVSSDQFGQRYIYLHFNSRGAAQFGKVSRENVNRQLAIILDGTLYSAPVIRGAIEGGQAQIEGQFSQEEAENISNALISGSLPVEIDVQGVFDTDPTLGAESLRNSMLTGLVSFIAVIIFMAIYYMRAGMIANVAMILNIVLLLGALAAFNCTLTLPGIAGIILTIGMVVDANVLIYERIREELDNKKTLLNAVDAGFDRAFITILDSNLTTILSGLILMWQGTGPIKGFAIALTLGITLNLFTSLFVTRLLFDVMIKFSSKRTLKMLRFFSRPNFNFLGTMKYVALAISTTLVVASLGFAAYKGKAILGIDFTGGTRITYEYTDRVPEQDIVNVLTQVGHPSAKISYKSNIAQNNRIIEIILPAAAEGKEINPKEQISVALNKAYPNAKFANGEEVTIGGLIGYEFSKAAVIAFLLSVVGMTIYLSMRFEFSYGAAAMIALVHDVIIAVGVFLFMGGELSLQVIAAALTIIGYSVNDTIIVFDRIREDIGLVKNKSYDEIINLSINQTLSRTVITSFTVFLVTLIMYIMGGNALKDFVFVMLVGVIVGTYSSFSIACIIVSAWHKRLGIDLPGSTANKTNPVPVK